MTEFDRWWAQAFPDDRHPDARPDWSPGDTPCAENGWACEICGKPGGHGATGIEVGCGRFGSHLMV